VSQINLEEWIHVNEKYNGMNLAQLIPDIETSAGPSWVIHEKQVWMAWRGRGTDSQLYVGVSSRIQPTLTTGRNGFKVQQKVPNARASGTPALASLDGAIYLFWREESDSAIHWAKCSDGKSWGSVQALEIEQRIGGNDECRAQTSHARAVASGRNCLYLFWKGHDTDIRIWWSTFNGAWTKRHVVLPVSGGVPKTGDSLGVTFDGSSVQLAWKGAHDDGIWWSTFSRGEWLPQRRIFEDATVAPAMVTDGNGIVWLVWITRPTGVAVHGELRFASLDCDRRWSEPSTKPDVSPELGPALLSIVSDSNHIMMAWKSPEPDSGVYYGPLLADPVLGI
jgi:hypothetical protein